MSLKVTIIPKSTYLHAIVEGLNSIENVKGYFEQIVKECTARNCFRLLVEERLEGPRLGTMEVFDLISSGSSRFLGMFKDVAFVDVNRAGDLMQFAETVASNRGFPLTVFSTVPEAEVWLQRTTGSGQHDALR